MKISLHFQAPRTCYGLKLSKRKISKFSRIANDESEEYARLWIKFSCIPSPIGPGTEESYYKYWIRSFFLPSKFPEKLKMSLKE